MLLPSLSHPSLPRLGQFYVHLIDLGLIHLLGHIALHLESWRQHVILHSEGLLGQENLLRFLQAIELLSLRNFIDRLQDLSCVGILVRIDLFGFKTLSFGPRFKGLLIWDNDTDCTIFEGVSVDHDLSYKL